jgi:hypothetical protein
MVGARRFFGSRSGVSHYVIDKRRGMTHGGDDLTDNVYLHTLLKRYRKLQH